MEVGILISELIRKTVIPLGVVGLLILAFYPVCTKNGTCDYFMLWILVGWRVVCGIEGHAGYNKFHYHNWQG